MNPNFDFRDSSVWDDRKVDYSVGDCFLVLGDFIGMGLVIAFLVFGVLG